MRIKKSEWPFYFLLFDWISLPTGILWLSDPLTRLILNNKFINVLNRWQLIQSLAFFPRLSLVNMRLYICLCPPSASYPVWPSSRGHLHYASVCICFRKLAVSQTALSVWVTLSVQKFKVCWSCERARELIVEVAAQTGKLYQWTQPSDVWCRDRSVYFSSRLNLSAPPKRRLASGSSSWNPSRFWFRLNRSDFSGF